MASDIDLAEYEGLVCQLAMHYGARPGRVMDSEQYADGWIGLVKARDKFRPELGHKFMTYAYSYVRGYILYGIRSRRPNRFGPPINVAAFSQIGDGRSFGDFQGASVVDPEPSHLIREECESLLGMLDERSRRFVRLSIFDRMTMEDIGRTVTPHLSRQRVQQVIREALDIMRHHAMASA